MIPRLKSRASVAVGLLLPLLLAPGAAKPKVLQICNGGACAQIETACNAVREKLDGCGFEVLKADALDLNAIETEVKKLGPNDPVLFASHGTTKQVGGAYRLCSGFAGNAGITDPQPILDLIKNHPVLWDTCYAGALPCTNCDQIILSCAHNEPSTNTGPNGMTEVEHNFAELLCDSISKCSLFDKYNTTVDRELDSGEVRAALQAMLGSTAIYQTSQFYLDHKPIPGETPSKEETEFRAECAKKSGKIELYSGYDSTCLVAGKISEGPKTGESCISPPLQDPLVDDCVQVLEKKFGPDWETACSCGPNLEYAATKCYQTVREVTKLTCKWDTKQKAIECRGSRQHPDVRGMKIQRQCP